MGGNAGGTILAVIGACLLMGGIGGYAYFSSIDGDYTMVDGQPARIQVYPTVFAMCAIAAIAGMIFLLAGLMMKEPESHTANNDS